LATDEIFYLSVEEVITLHVLLMRELQEVRFGVDRKDLLESALNRPNQAANFEDADLIRQAASLCFGLIKNHPWIGGNKRTATYLMETFLEMNGFDVTATNDEIVEMVLVVESDAWKVEEIENWLREKVKELKNA
jgi:death-on-curing protein